MDFLISIAAKDLSVAGNALLVQKTDFGKEKLELLEQLQHKMRVASRFKSEKVGT